MKQFLLLAILTVSCSLGAFATPFWGVLLYYALAALRPQYLWAWALPVGVRWSLIAAGVTILTTLLHLGGIVRRAQLNLVLGLMAVYVVLLIFSMLGANDPATAQHWATEYGKVFLMAGIASLVIERFAQVRWIALAVAVSLAFIAYEINFQYFFEGGRLDVFHLGFGGLDNNGAGLTLAMGVPLALSFAAGAWNRSSVFLRLVPLGGTLLLMHGVMMTYSRGAMLAASVGVLWQVIHHRPRHHALLGAAALVAAALVLAGPEIRGEFLSTQNFQQDDSAQSRFNSWKAGWRIAWDNPVLGAGIRNSNQLTQRYGADIRGRTIHNQYLQIAADSGIPAATVYLVMLSVAIWRLGQACRRCAQLQDEHADDPRIAREFASASAVCLGLQASLVTFAFNGLFLSLEVFELPWLLIVLAGVAPPLIERSLRQLTDAAEAPEHPEPAVAPRLSPALSLTGAPAPGIPA